MPGMDHPALRRAFAAALLFALLCPALRAQPSPTRLSYATYIGGLNAVDIDASIAISPQRYRLQLSYRLTGLVGAIVHGDGATTVDGRFQGELPMPGDLLSTGHFRGRPYVMRLEWRDGTPVVTQLDPPDREEREPVPPEQQADTVDSLSAMAALLHQVASTGRCDGVRRTFDGRRLSELQARTVGEESLPQTSRSSFTGTALRCDFEGRQLAGFLRDADQAGPRRVQRGSAWFARLVPGGPPLPIRITFDARSFGEATMYLTAQP